MGRQAKPQSTTVKATTKILPISLQQIKLPIFNEKVFSGQEYVRYGEDNRFPQFLQMLCDRSALHNAIITTKVDYAYGSGFNFEDSEGNLLTKAFINHPNPYEDLNSIYKKCLYDYILYGAFSINVIWDADKEHIAELYHCDTSRIRSGLKNRFGVVENYFYSDNWLKTYTKGFTKIPTFNTKDRKGSQLMYVKEYRPGITYYALPSYCGALNSIATDIEITNFHLSHLLNGMSPSKMITFTDGIPSDEEERMIKRQIEDVYTGSDNAGKFVLSFVSSPDKVPNIETLGGDDLGDQFIQLESSVLNQILAGHKVTSPLLVGLRTDNNGLGSNSEEILEAFHVFTNTVIKPLQEVVVKAFNELIKYTKGYNGLVLEPTINTPVEFTYSESVLTQICTVNELRERIGLTPIEKNSIENE